MHPPKGSSRIRLILGLLVVLALTSSTCSGGDERAETPSNAQGSPDSDDAVSEESNSSDDSPEPAAEATSFDFDTGGLIDYLDDSFPDTGFSSEISLMFIAEELVLINLQTSFFEPDEAVALCEAVAAFVDAAGGPGKIEFVSTSGSDVAVRATSDSECEAGADVS